MERRADALLSHCHLNELNNAARSRCANDQVDALMLMGLKIKCRADDGKEMK